MAQQIINISNPNDHLGDPLRTAFDKSNDNFTELYAPQSIVFSGGIFRLRATATALCIDQTITPLGFAGAEDTDWEQLTEFGRP